MPDSQDDLTDQPSDRHKKIDEQIAWFLASLGAILTAWQSGIDDLISGPLPSDHGSSRLVELRYLTDQITGQLTRLGYVQLADQFIVLYDDAETHANEQQGALDLPAKLPSPEEHDERSTVRAIHHSKLTAIAETAIGALAAGIVLARISGESAADVKAIVAHAVSEFQRDAVRSADMGLLYYDRLVTWQTFRGVVKEWLYAGPRDQRNRPFCAEHVGGVYTDEDIARMDNGQNPPFNDVRLYLGGYGCRHMFSPVKANNEPRGN